MKLDINFVKRTLIYILSLFILATGITFTIQSNLGVSPVSLVPYIVSVRLKMDLGLITFIFYSSYILIQWIILKKDFELINIMQIVFSSIFGYFLDFTTRILADLSLTTYFTQLIGLFIGIVLIALAICLILDVNFVTMPFEGLVKAVNQRFFPQKQFHTIKMSMDICSVIIGTILSLIFFGKLVGIREGTVLSAIFIGKVMHPIQHLIRVRVQKFVGID